MIMKRYFYIICTFYILNSCNQSADLPEVSFYYWKTVFMLNETEISALRNNHVKSLYIRYFDVDLSEIDQKPVPVSPVEFKNVPDSFTIIPVIYIKNIVMKQKDMDMHNLAVKIINLVKQINNKNNLRCNEIQIDCDWSLESRDNFMKFIDLIKKEYRQKLSVTIRLHQVKYFYRTKVPNADYGVLMYYNMGKIASDSLNSIYDKNIAEKYLNNLKNYPLHLDIALPVFTNAILIRKDRVVNLINKIDLKSLYSDTNFIKVSDRRIKAKNSNFKAGFYFKKDDEIKIESISFDDLEEMANELSKNLAEKPVKIIVFDLDSINLIPYHNENQNFSEIANRF